MKHEGWDLLGDLGLELSGARIELLERYEDLLTARALPMGMVARSDRPRLRERHILDSLRAVPLLRPDARTACDLGSGAGLPGIPIAIARPELLLTLVEVRRNRAAFLTEAVQALGLPNVTVHARRVETFRSQVDVALARAFANARAAWAAATAMLGLSGVLVYWAGERFDPATEGPPGVPTATFPTSTLARAGPLVIMGQQ